MSEEKYAVLNVALGDITGNKFFNVDPEIGIGREATSNAIVIPNLNVSRKHAKVYKNDDDYILEDLGSHNGTLLNGRLARKEILRDGDVISIADVEIRFQLGEEKVEDPSVKLSNTDVGEIAKDTTEFIDLSELNREKMEKLRDENPSASDPWLEDEE